MATLNGDFPTDVSGWVVDGTSTITWQGTTYAQSPGSAFVVTDATADHGATYTMTGDAAQNSTWDATAYLQQHTAGDNARHMYLSLVSVGGTAESQKSADVVLGPGWQQATLTFQFLQAAHTASQVCVRQSGAGAAINCDVDSVRLARHLTYAPASNPLNSSLWIPGVPAAAWSCPNDALTAQLIASSLYAGA